MANGLNPKQAAFVREYLIDHNGTQAAIRAGYSEKTASSKASQLLGIVKVAEAIKQGESELAEKAELTKEESLRMLAEIARGEVRTEKVTKMGVVEVLPDFGERMKAVELSGKYTGRLVERTDHSGVLTVRVVREDQSQPE